jgi:hypothetical protein
MNGTSAKWKYKIKKKIIVCAKRKTKEKFVFFNIVVFGVIVTLETCVDVVDARPQ